MAWRWVEHQHQASDPLAGDARRAVHDTAVLRLSGPAASLEQRDVAGLHCTRLRRVFVRPSEHGITVRRRHPLGARPAVGADQAQRHAVTVPASAGVVGHQIQAQPHGMGLHRRREESDQPRHIGDESIALWASRRARGIATRVQCTSRAKRHRIQAARGQRVVRKSIQPCQPGRGDSAPPHGEFHTRPRNRTQDIHARAKVHR